MENLEKLDFSKHGVYKVKQSQLKDFFLDFSSIDLNNLIKKHLNTYSSGNEFLEVQFINESLEVTEQKKEIIQNLMNSEDILGSLSKLSCSTKLFGIQNVLPELKKLLSDFFTHESKAVTANMYITPRVNKSCFKYHVDPHDVIALQLLGKKEWLFPKQKDGQNHLNYPFEAGSTPMQSFNNEERLDLETSEMIFISRGHVHKAINTSSDLSIHLSFSVFYPNQFDKLQLITKDLITFEKEYLKQLMNRTELSLEAVDKVKRDLEEKIEKIDYQKKFIVYEKKEQIKNAFIAKFGRPYGPNQKALFQKMFGA